jgi:MFS family permease
MEVLDAPVPVALRSALLPLAAMVFLGFLAIGLPLPVLPRQVHDVLGFGTVTVGFAIGLQSVATLLSRPMAGRLCDRRGPKQAALLGLAVSTLAGALYLLSDHAGAGAGGALALLLAGRLVLGLGESFLITGALAWGVAWVGAPRTGKVMVWVGIAMYGAIGLGAPAGQALDNWFGFDGVALGALLAPVPALAIALACRGVARLHGVPMPMLAVLRRIWLAGAGLALAVTGFASIAAFLPLAFAARGWGQSGLGLTAFGAAYVGARLLFGHLPDRFGGRRVAMGSLLVECAGLLLLWLAPTPELAALGAFVTGFGFSLVFPGFGVEAVHRVPAHSRGVALGGYVGFFDVALGVAAPALGVLAGQAGYPSVFLAAALACLLAVFAGYLLAQPAGA